MSVTYEAVLDVSEGTVQFLVGLLDAERVRRRTRAGTRVLSTRQQAILTLRWYLDDTRMSSLARDFKVSETTAYDYRDEAVAVLKVRKPTLSGALLAAKIAGHTHVIVDGTLIETDRVQAPGPTKGVDLWWSGKHKRHGGNVQVVSAPDGWPLWTSDVRPGREHDVTAARTHPDFLATIKKWVDDLERKCLTDLGYEGEPATFTLPYKTPPKGELTDDEKAYNTLHSGIRCLGERANALLKVTFKNLRRVRGCPWRISDIVAAALVLLHVEHNRTT